MTIYFINMRILTLLLCLISFVYSRDRKIISKLNPGCLECTSTDTNLVYVTAEGSHDTIHQIWDFTKGFPTTIFIVTEVNTTMTILWNKKEVVNFTLSDKPLYSFAFVIDKVIEFDDIVDHGELTDHCPQRWYDLRNLEWNRTSSILTDQEALLTVEARKYKAHNGWRSGVISLRLDLLPYKDYAPELPHLIHTANSTLVDVSLVNMTTSRDYNSSRFALHYIIVSTDSSNDTIEYTMRKSLDDEHTPGVFEIVEIKTPECYRNAKGGYIQYRPVGYTEKERNVASSTNAHTFLSHNTTKLPNHSTVFKFYEDFDKENLLVKEMFISFGESGGGFYDSKNYTAWSYTIGYGKPPTEAFSLFVILVISIGLGVPVLLALSGIIYVVARKYRSGYAQTRLTEDD